MKKEEQLEMNLICYNHFNIAMEERRKLYAGERHYKKLRSCQAEVLETENYYLLRSYNTFIACIRKDSDTLYDVLRTEYGYTSTSCHHISKFEKDYCKGKWSCAFRFTARPI